MFFFFSIFSDEKRLDFYHRGLCPICSNTDEFYIVMTYSCFSLFFIPIFKFNKRYFLKSANCASVCEISKEYANRLIEKEDTLDPFKIPFFTNYRKEKYCENCGFKTSEDYVYCPKCSTRLK